MISLQSFFVSVNRDENANCANTNKIERKMPEWKLLDGNSSSSSSSNRKFQIFRSSNWWVMRMKCVSTFDALLITGVGKMSNREMKMKRDEYFHRVCSHCWGLQLQVKTEPATVHNAQARNAHTHVHKRTQAQMDEQTNAYICAPTEWNNR